VAGPGPEQAGARCEADAGQHGVASLLKSYVILSSACDLFRLHDEADKRVVVQAGVGWMQ
jgi:hypothetical protein